MNLRVGRARAVLVAALATGAATGAADPLLGLASAHPGTTEDALVTLCGLALFGCLAWAWLATVAVAVEVWRGTPVSVPGVPTVVRRVVLAACGAALTGALAAPAQSADRDPVLAGLPVPERAVGRAHPTALSGPPEAPPAPARWVVVRPGDSLWLIAARDLFPGADDATVAACWQRIYRLNRTLVGPDPDLIHPGQRLRLPGPPTLATR